LIGHHLVVSKLYYVIVVIGSFWLLTFLTLFGLNFSARIATYLAVIGIMAPIVLIICGGFFWVFSGKPLATQLNWQSILPNFSSGGSWVALTAIMTSFLGVELATVHVRSISNAKQVFPRAMFYSVVIIILTMIFGALAIAVMIPVDQIKLVTGVMKMAQILLNKFHLAGWLAFFGVLLLLGSLGEMINWVISPAKGLHQAAEHGFLPPICRKLNKYGMPTAILISQAVLVTIVVMAYVYLPSINSSYWFLTSLSTQIYLIMYLLMFAAALYLRRTYVTSKAQFSLPGRGGLFTFVCLLGICGVVLGLVSGFVPPKSLIGNMSVSHYEMAFVGSIILAILSAFLFLIYKQLGQSGAARS